VTPAIEISDVIKDYRGLRPLRIESLAVGPHELIAVLGLDQASAEVLINLITGTTLPDRGTVRVFGQSTADIADSAEWVRVVDRFGILSERAVLLDGFSALQNLSIPFTLDVEPPSSVILERAQTLAGEAGLDPRDWERRVAELDGNARARVRLGRSLALDPEVLLLEHPTAGVGRDDVQVFGRLVRSAVERRGAAALALTADVVFARAAAKRVLTLSPSTGRLTETRQGWLARWLE
jgi:ABC-type transporter Mla maintaining outer membrane lipid asymmetry ATPase subunit MlaF